MSSLWKVTVDACLAIRLSLRRVNETYYSKWRVEGQDVTNFVAIQSYIPKKTIGLYTRDVNLHRVSFKNGTYVPFNYISGAELLIGEQLYIVPKNCIQELNDQEIDLILNEEKQRKEW